MRTTDLGVSIEKRIKDGETLVFDSVLEADTYAKNNFSYYYPVYLNGRTSGQYAVPK